MVHVKRLTSEKQKSQLQLLAAVKIITAHCSALLPSQLFGQFLMGDDYKVKSLP